MPNVGWYARDGHLDFLPRVAKELETIMPELRSFYICHDDFDKDHLASVYGIRDPFVLARSISSGRDDKNITARTFKELENEYPALPLIRALWNALFEHRMKEETAASLLIRHLRAWKHFLKINQIHYLITEVPSIISTAAAWLVCKKIGVEFVAFVNIPPLQNRVAFSSSWEGYYDAFEKMMQDLGSLPIDHASPNYDKTRGYLEKMKNHPTKTQDAVYFMNIVQRQLTALPLSRGRLAGALRYLRDHRKKRQYYIRQPLSRIFLAKLSMNLNLCLYRWLHIFERPSQQKTERYFLFPLHMYHEYSNYTWMGVSYRDQAAIIARVSGCLPLGAKLYVKEHTSQLGEKSLCFYQRIKRLRGVRLIDPHADTFQLIKNSAGIITLGSTVGFEAFLMNKPVIALGRPWYKNFTGIYRTCELDTLAQWLQNADKLKTAAEEEKLRIVYALYEASFEGKVHIPFCLESENIANFATAFAKKMTQ